MDIIIAYGTTSGDIVAVDFNFSNSSIEHDYILTKENVHKGPVTSINFSESEIISGGEDGSLIATNVLKTQPVALPLNHSKGVVSIEKSFDGEKLVTASSDGSIIIWNKFSNVWDFQKKILEIKKPVKSYALHPSNVLGLSVGSDQILRVWDMCTGKQAYYCNMKTDLSKTLFSPSGKYYAVLTRTKVLVSSLSDATFKFNIDCGIGFKDILFITDDIICVMESSDIKFYSISLEKELNSIKSNLFRFTQINVVKKENVYILIASTRNQNKYEIHFYDISSVVEIELNDSINEIQRFIANDIINTFNAIII